MNSKYLIPTFQFQIKISTQKSFTKLMVDELKKEEYNNTLPT